MAGAVPALAQEPAADPATDPRSQTLLELDCASELGRRAVTLFGNGTVRLREGPRGGEKVFLAELGPEELQGYRRRLEEEDLGETDRRTDSPEGDWVESCRLDLRLPDRPAQTYRFARHGSLSLALSRVLALAQELGDRVEVARAGAHRLPPGYRPRPGDVLERRDGARFRVVGFTSDKRGVELAGVEQPLVVFVSLDDLAGEFVALVPGRRP